MREVEKLNLAANCMPDYKVAEIAETDMPRIYDIAADLDITMDELIPYGHYMAKVDFARLLERKAGQPDGKYVEVTAITPTPLGEGKTTTTMGLVQGLGRRGHRVSGGIRQPSGGPTFNIKGSAAGGGRAQCIPLTPFSLGLTGDIDAVVNAHNLAMVALTARMQHEFNYDDATLAEKNLKRISVDPRNVEMKWVMDFCAQSLRDIIIGLGDTKLDGFMMRSGFAIAVSSEVMAILAIATSLADMRERMGRIIVACDRNGAPVTTADLEVDGAMTAWMVRALNPNILQTLEGQPVFVHAGPFANIAVGQSSIVSDRIALKCTDYHVTESGFGADIGFEKFWNIKCRLSGMTPNCSVIVATIRALKMHGGGPTVVPGRPLDAAYTSENAALVEQGCENLVAHIETVRKAGITPVVCINSFSTDTPSEIAIIRRVAETAGARCALSNHWALGGEGALELADAVVEACNEPPAFKLLYDQSAPLRQRIEIIAREVYGADGVEYSSLATEKAKRMESSPDFAEFATCMVKTHLSLSHIPALKNRPKNWTLFIRDILTYGGAKFLVPVAGDIKLMPGTSSDPAFRRIDVDTASGRVKGLF